MCIQVKLPEGNDIAKALNITEANFTGFSGVTFHENLYNHYGRDYTTAGGDVVNFAVVFGVLFSGVTGMQQKLFRVPNISKVALH